jgi:hypothetical protein
MPSVNFTRFFLGVEVRAELSVGASNEEEPHVPLPATPPDDRECELSPVGQQMQRQARELAKCRTEEEREADDESLDLLEATTAANSTAAKIKDRESLEWLIRCTKRLNNYRKIFKTPSHPSFWPAPRHFKGMDGTPLSFEPPFSTPSEVRNMYEGEPKNEFEEFLAKNRVQSAHEWLEKKKSRNSFSALLESTKATGVPPPTTAAERSEHMKREVQSLIDLFDQVAKQDEAEEILARGLPDAIESPIASPTSSIKHLPKGSGILNGETTMVDGMLIDLTDTEELRSGTPDSDREAEDGVASPTSNIKHLSRDGDLSDSFDDEETRSKQPDSDGESDEGNEEDESAEGGPATPDSAGSGASDEDEWDFV